MFMCVRNNMPGQTYLVETKFSEQRQLYEHSITTSLRVLLWWWLLVY